VFRAFVDVFFILIAEIGQGIVTYGADEGVWMVQTSVVKLFG